MNDITTVFGNQVNRVNGIKSRRSSESHEAKFRALERRMVEESEMLPRPNSRLSEEEATAVWDEAKSFYRKHGHLPSPEERIGASQDPGHVWHKYIHCEQPGEEHFQHQLKVTRARQLFLDLKDSTGSGYEELRRKIQSELCSLKLALEAAEQQQQRLEAQEERRRQEEQAQKQRAAEARAEAERAKLEIKKLPPSAPEPVRKKVVRKVEVLTTRAKEVEKAIAPKTKARQEATRERRQQAPKVKAIARAVEIKKKERRDAPKTIAKKLPPAVKRVVVEGAVRTTMARAAAISKATKGVSLLDAKKGLERWFASAKLVEGQDDDIDTILRTCARLWPQWVITAAELRRFGKKR